MKMIRNLLLALNCLLRVWKSAMDLMSLMIRLIKHARFKQQVDARAGGDAEAHHYDADYIHALEYGLPPTVGVGIGIDRLDHACLPILLRLKM